MKLRNLLFGTMIACAFVACSNDDDPIDNGGGNGNTDATLSVKYEAPIITKSGNTTGEDNTIASLNVYVFNGTGENATLEATGTLAAGTDSESKNIAVKAGDKSVVVVANATPSNITTLGSLYNATKEFGDTEKNGTISMNSRTYVVSVIAGETNYLGYKKTEATGGNYLVPTEATGGDLNDGAVKLYRNVAKINLEKITVNTSGATNKYSNAKFYPTDVFVLHANKMTKIVGGAAPWASTEFTGEGQAWLGGPSDAAYTEWKGIVNEWLEKDSKNKVKKNYVNPYVGGFAAWTTSVDFPKGGIVENSTWPEQAAGQQEVTSVDYFYAYENTNANLNTLLVVKGKFVYGENADASKFPERYYSVSVGIDGNPTFSTPAGGSARQETGVLRNLQYNIALTIQGPGWETPFGPDGGENTALDVKVQVVDFSYVSQDVTIE